MYIQYHLGGDPGGTPYDGIYGEDSAQQAPFSVFM